MPAASWSPVERSPAERVDQRRQGDAGVGDPAADNDVRVEAQRLGHRQRAEVGVGREHVPGVGQERGSGLQVAQVHPGRHEFAQAPGDVVTLHHGDAQLQTLGPGHRRQGLGAGLGVDPAGVGDDADPAQQDLLQQRLDLADEVPGVAGRRVLGLLLLQDAHGDFGQEIHGDVVERQGAEHLPAQGVGIVPPVASGIADPDTRALIHRLPHIRSTPIRVASTGLERAQARDAARTARVERMSITPSSHSRAEA